MRAGFDLLLSKPLQRAQLTAAINSLKLDPVISTLIGDANMTELIDGFAAEMPARIERLRAPLRAEDWPTLAQAVSDIRIDAASYGFELIDAAASELLRVLGERSAGAAIAPKVAALTRYCEQALGASCKHVI